jgi:hypothetical protein
MNDTLSGLRFSGQASAAELARPNHPGQLAKSRFAEYKG